MSLAHHVPPSTLRKSVNSRRMVLLPSSLSSSSQIIELSSRRASSKTSSATIPHVTRSKTSSLFRMISCFSRGTSMAKTRCAAVPLLFVARWSAPLRRTRLFRVALQIPDKSMKALKLLPHTNMAAPNQLNFNPMFGVATSVTPPPALNKLVIAADIDLKPSKLLEFQALSKLSEIQHWYNAVHARGHICGICTSPWEAFDKHSDMGSKWYIAHLDQTILDKRDIMPAAVNTLLSSKGIFKGKCDNFTRIVINSSGDGYSALYNIVCMVHSLLGQVTTQPPQPSQRKAQSFSEHVTNYIGYFQSESCSG
jgi:hypothetical protein